MFISLQRMKKLAALLLLLSHMNTSMFLPQVAMEDAYDSNGQQTDDITSVVEYIRVTLGYDKTADDENDDSGQNFHVVKNIGYSFQQAIIVVENQDLSEIKKRSFSEYKIPGHISPCFDIITPPPNAS